jgi:formylglycine-generating enzyme required for sulfatase activity
MATIHLGRQLGAAGFVRTVAIKRLHEPFARDSDFVARFLDEARLVARARHANVVQTLDVVAENGELFVVMEYVHGVSLARGLSEARRRDAPPSIATVSAVFIDALCGLHAAHEARGEAGEALGILHREFSPHNVLVGVDGVARLDFGVAYARERLQSTGVGEPEGKRSYMAPEQLRGELVDRRADIYSAGVVLWEALTGSKLFEGTGITIATRILEGSIPLPSERRLGISAELDQVVMRALARDPAARFATAAEMAMAVATAASPAPPAEVSAWISSTCPTALGARAASCAALEARTPSWRPGVAPGSSGHSSPESVPPVSIDDLTVCVKAKTSRRVLSLGGPVALGAFGAILAATVASSLFARREILSSNVPLPAVTIGRPSRPADSVLPAASMNSESRPAPLPCPQGMVLVAGGEFFMGSDDGRTDERPAHHVTLHAFCIDRFEVTRDAYKSCSDRGACKRAGTANQWAGIARAEARAYNALCTGPRDDRGTHPINCLEWSQADRYCRATGGRLPTEAEWEYAARGSDGRKYPWGDEAPSARLLNACGSECVAWGRRHGEVFGRMYQAADGWVATAPVGSFPDGASRWGAMDMVGNVWEWVADRYGPYHADDSIAPQGPRRGETRVVRGGSWNGASPDWARPTYRFGLRPDTRSHGVGFRCATSP